MNPRIFLFAAALASLAAAADDPNKHDLDQNRKHHEALAEKNRDIEALKAEASKWRAAAERCHDINLPTKSPSSPDLGGSRGALDR